MPSSKAATERMTNKITEVALGIDWSALIRMANKVPGSRDPVTGIPELADLQRRVPSELCRVCTELQLVTSLHSYCTLNPEDPDVANVMQAFTSQLNLQDRQEKDLNKVDFSALPIQQHVIWSIEVKFAGYQTSLGEYISTDSPIDPKERALLRQVYSLQSNIELGPRLEGDLFRWMDKYTGMPDSEQLENFIKASIANPYPLYEPSLPHLLIIPANLSHHVAAVKPFLDSLPEPFSWKVTKIAKQPENPARITGNIDEKTKFKLYMSIAKAKKESGNKSFAARNSEAAVSAYVEAITYLDKALHLSNESNSAIKKESSKLQAVCYANCSAARLISGTPNNSNLEKAVNDAEQAILLDACYAKGYVRLARAYESLGKFSDAEEAIARALRLRQLENEEGLVDHLIYIQTHGQGLPEIHSDNVKDWVKETFLGGIGGSERAERMKDVGGLWRKKCDEHLKKIQRSMF